MLAGNMRRGAVHGISADQGQRLCRTVRFARRTGYGMVRHFPDGAAGDVDRARVLVGLSERGAFGRQPSRMDLTFCQLVPCLWQPAYLEACGAGIRAIPLLPGGRHFLELSAAVRM